jgi:hypothetical protein
MSIIDDYPLKKSLLLSNQTTNDIYDKKINCLSQNSNDASPFIQSYY